MGRKEKEDERQKKELPVDLMMTMAGDGGVGKTALIYQFTLGEFASEYDPTIEDDFLKEVTIDDERHIIHVYDPAGGGQYYCGYRDRWIEEATFFLLTYSITDRSSYDAVVPQLKHIQRVKDGVDYSAVLVGNKVDLEEEHRQVARVEGEDLARSLGIPFVEVSAKTGEGVEELFLDIAKYHRDGSYPYSIYRKNVKRAR
eukprot:CAMPEP_0201516034 /NCGR_PEP_ID=MMETSP0161_2-20130828/7453_1 /ASSEMBLY_ACC=CAM_ASM_000251 /TAXON_ID=180227 /ORGANISM="Neoparamoeba aestuarina, Strain SoJaBio B1-5/56/2" /LENGTH=199 /DNA_ID=CAMNT_0047913023 /DNA_START=74 /DNA_END=673 /DNA_ORIENTATION=-